MLLAHIRESDHAEQSVQHHLEEVAALARRYGETINAGAHAELAGFLHDMGKLTVHFTHYLKNAVLENNVAKEKMDHSTAGAKYLYDSYYGQEPVQDMVIETVGMAILSHHSGLQNFVQPDLKPSDFVRRVTNGELPHYDEVVQHFESVDGNQTKVERLLNEAVQEFRSFLEKISRLDYPKVYLNLFQKLVFSCLIDADRTNTRCFEEGETVTENDSERVFKEGYRHLMGKVGAWQQDTRKLNQLRNLMSDNCDKVATDPSGIYTLTIPTGGGKTFASLRYALKHALENGMKRIIYVVPYTTILEQNAQAVRSIIQQPEAVLEHHANVIDDAQQDEGQDFYDSAEHKKMQLGRDNWDYPIIFTTMVQFLDAFYQKGTRKSRRMHRLTNSVIVFDEVQSVPFQHYALFNAAVNFLHSIGGSSIILCTATQPAVDRMTPPLNLAENAEIVPNLADVADAFKRVSVHSHVGPEGWPAERISEFAQGLLLNTNSILIILNTKTAVRKLYQLLSGQEAVRVIHLSTSMCPAHRKERLDQVKSSLGKEKVICVSTQLIEAGVDISFETVIRSLAGLDSIAQAAGRCNRNQEREVGDVHVIRAADENLSKLPEIRIGAEVTADYILADSKFKDHLLSPMALKTYFSYFQSQAKREIKVAPKGFDYPLFSLLDGSLAERQSRKTKSMGMYKTLENHFEAIDSPTTAVIVPYGEGEEIIARLNENTGDFSEFNRLLKSAQQYSVNLYQHELQALSSTGMIHPLFEAAIFCLNKQAYDPDYGVTLDGQAEQAPYQY
ncbi:CRISPR-associated helicase Cas3' [Bhargavaea beijingensis]|uniref:CRISPR-associated helicase Cas3' n=1 Tax=Bhargavaea beijingensis TaxID=426756 RepID=UPI001639D376|nr:CRISPR-associated helicase Cas3' [Bhargavaea beijingensis]